MTLIKTIIIELTTKGFSSEHWCQNAGSAFEKIARRDNGLDKNDISLLRSWIIRDTDLLSEREKVNKQLKETNQKRNVNPDRNPSAILFGRNRGGYSIPSENYTFLSAIFCGLLFR